ncbi:MAG TPA: ATP-binding cassette domain-containing protein [Roseiarcus sp.]|nr:ATP-binding cassette domain-containing protein [Roseiarcus sp.]
MAAQASWESVAEGSLPIVEAVGASRAFGPVEVLSDVCAAFRAGEAHAIIGENGAGESTLTKILAGHLTPTRGTLRLDGEPSRCAARSMPGGAASRSCIRISCTKEIMHKEEREGLLFQRFAVLR